MRALNYISSCEILPTVWEILRNYTTEDFCYFSWSRVLQSQNWLWVNVKTSENKNVIDIVVIIGLHIVRCTEVELLSPTVSCYRTHYRSEGCDAVNSDIRTDI
jgi:hypothetical protein